MFVVMPKAWHEMFTEPFTQFYRNRYVHMLKYWRLGSLWTFLFHDFNSISRPFHFPTFLCPFISYGLNGSLNAFFFGSVCFVA